MAKNKTTIHGLIPGEGLGLDEVRRTMTGSKLTPPPFNTRTLWSAGLVKSVLHHHLSPAPSLSYFSITHKLQNHANTRNTEAMRHRAYNAGEETGLKKTGGIC